MVGSILEKPDLSPSQVPLLTYEKYHYRYLAQLVRACAYQLGGRGFEPIRCEFPSLKIPAGAMVGMMP